MKIKFKKLSPDATTPTRGSNDAAGYDLYANNYDFAHDLKDWTLMILPGETVKVYTDIAIEIPNGYFGGIYARSGLACKSGLAPANKVGIIDSDYRGPLIVCLYNQSSVPQIIHKGDRIAQLIVQPYLSFEWEEVTDLEETQRGDKGFGSTGIN